MPEDPSEEIIDKHAESRLTDGISRRELLVELFRRMRGAARMVLNRKPKLVKTVEYVLRSFLQRESRMSLDRFPREHFCTQQVVLVGIFVLHGLQSRTLTFLELREDLGNLAYLLDFLRLHHPKDAAFMQAYLRKYLAMLEELCSIFEKATQVIRTDWASLKDAYQRFETLPPSVERELFVPPVAEIVPSKLLGAGGFGACYKVKIGGAVLVGKLIPLERMKSPKHACLDKVVASVISSPFLIAYHSCFSTDRAYVTIMECVKGVDLNRLIKRGEPLDPVAIPLILAQLGLAVRYLHFRGFIHRDIKPANIMVLLGCRMKLIDFDTCKICTSLYGDGYTRSFRSRTFGEFRDSEVAGTLVFFSPETIARESYGRATDFWAIGVTAFIMGSGKLPFRGNDENVRKNIWAAEYPPLRNQPRLAQLIARLLVRDPKRRITTARFEEYQMEEIFRDVNWEKLDVDHLHEMKQFSDLMQHHDDGGWSLIEKSERKLKKKTRFQLKFSDVADAPKQEKLFTFSSNSFHKFLVTRSRNQGSDVNFVIHEGYDFIPEFTERRQRVTYRFQDALKWQSYNTGPRSSPSERSARL
ncbi:microtubule-associated serine/threonine-protein kinase 4-like [Galendromus occidentalis]|uniref:Serine/threonine-protein kinase greatwall n=1 Tax=Galendromus occidentalis TaxID=34638 RepID=A0AAJ6QYA6_9ACAR|nr:microtubule-associated serine/threonine-protein kinase 4-like [Galendromus occidentalis]